MANTLDENLSYVANAPFELEIMGGDIAFISKLDDEPNDVGGMTSAELKAEFDKAGLAIQRYLNEYLVPKIVEEDATNEVRAASEAERVANEATRVANEEARISAEAERVSSEAQRVENEIRRENAETGYVARAESAAESATQAAAIASTAATQATESEAAAKAAQTAAEKAAADAQSAVGGDFVTRPELEEAIEAIPKPDVSAEIEAHNTSSSAHSDIREAVSDAASAANAAKNVSASTASALGLPNGASVDTALAKMGDAAFLTHDSTPIAVTGLDWYTAEFSGIGTTNGWRDVVYGDGKFVAISATAVGVSPDGVNWTVVSWPFTNYPNRIAYGDGTFVAVGANQSQGSFYSSDGLNWTAVALPSGSVYIGGIAYGAGKFVVTATSNSNQVYYSTDKGRTWQRATAGQYASWDDVAYGNGMFVAVSGYGGERETVMQSTDGINWTAYYGLSWERFWKNIDFVNGSFVATTAQDNGFAIYVSGGGWRTSTLPKSGHWFKVVHDGEKYIAFMDGATSAAISYDGSNWSTAVLPGTTANSRAVCYNDGKIVAMIGPSTVALSETIYPQKLVNALGEDVLMRGGAKIETGSYTGTNTYGSSNKNSLTFSFEPKLVFITGYAQSEKGTSLGYHTFVFVRQAGQQSLAVSNGSGYYTYQLTLIATWGGNSLAWYNSGATNGLHQFNGSGYTYNYVAIG